ncbi:hypothetical protein BDZ45DRAFT_240218 [Acephala macrosclerotiorum]|nr:hypothetical protein BDZ45DRAFT_240218 [Acephala macrosclerotiorum]
MQNYKPKEGLEATAFTLPRSKPCPRPIYLTRYTRLPVPKGPQNYLTVGILPYCGMRRIVSLCASPNQTAVVKGRGMFRSPWGSSSPFRLAKSSGAELYRDSSITTRTCIPVLLSTASQKKHSQLALKLPRLTYSASAPLHILAPSFTEVTCARTSHNAFRGGSQQGDLGELCLV